MKGKKKIWLIPLVLLIIAVPVLFILKKDKNSGPVTFDTALVKPGSVANTISATGTVEPLDKVDVGTQVSGVVEKIYVDYNSTVKKGQLLAELDKTTLKASLQSAMVNLNSTKIEYDFVVKKQQRIALLFQKNMVSQEEFDQATYEVQRSKANVEKAETEVQRAKLNLSYATIYSPIDGTVLSRSVDEGQTVAASLNAPTLFTIARDLARMAVNAAVDEADIGQVKQNQRVIFTVDAFPGEEFHGKVSQVRLEPTVTSNVVTYTVTILAENNELKLLPGMTATITVFVKEVQNVLTIPSRALRFQPDADLLQKLHGQFSKGNKEKMPRQSFAPGENGVGSADSSNKVFSGERRREPQDGGKRDGRFRENADPAQQKDIKRVWVKNGDLIRPVRIKTGISDATTVEVIEGLKEGDEVILSVNDPNKKTFGQKNQGPTSVNPFMPQRSGGRGRMR
ncbi:MAG: efflux RND transporter periplasmic adaptor subunit [Fibrobacter sp.]|nr:efflux RND transporter periplasmic adaptor subunit [Fibrobacter sp.]